MPDGEAIPITKGIEIQKSKMEDMRVRALNRYRDLAELSRLIESNIDEALSTVPPAGGMIALVALFDKKHALDEIGRELEDLILRGFEHEDASHDRWLALEERFESLKATQS